MQTLSEKPVLPEVDAGAEYAAGTWIMHCGHGLGQIAGVEEKSISGTATRYYRVVTSTSTYWLPVSQIGGEETRPLASRAEMEQALAVLGMPPEKMSSSFTVRQSEIQHARECNTPGAMAVLVRDLRARQREKGILNQNERSAYATFKQRLLEEWEAISGAPMEFLTARFEALLNPTKSAGD